MADRVVAIGDIHGCSLALANVVEAIDPDATDTIVTLGDYVNRGPDSRGVLDQLIDLGDRCRHVPLLGNHDQMLLHNRATRSEFPGEPVRDPETRQERFREDHFDFLARCVLYYETESHFFVHANYDAAKSLADQDSYTLLWQSLDKQFPRRHYSGKTAIVGHTPQYNGEVLDRGHLLCIDTNCHGGRWLTALDVNSGQVWQANRDGARR